MIHLLVQYIPPFEKVERDGTQTASTYTVKGVKPMNTIDLKAQTAFHYSKDCFFLEPPKHFLKLGADHFIYLSFSLPLWLNDWVVQKARLILYKLTPSDDPHVFGRYLLFPLQEPFNVCGYADYFPSVSIKDAISFTDSCKSYTQIDLTHMVQRWQSNRLENNGILLMGKNCAPTIVYASPRHCLSQMCPVLRLTCINATIPLSLQTVDCHVDVSNSKKQS